MCRGAPVLSVGNGSVDNLLFWGGIVLTCPSVASTLRLCSSLPRDCQIGARPRVLLPAGGSDGESPLLLFVYVMQASSRGFGFIRVIRADAPERYSFESRSHPTFLCSFPSGDA